MSNDLELRKQVAGRLGYKHLKIRDSDRQWGPVLTGFHSILPSCVSPYELSLDVCMKDLIPIAKEQGFNIQLHSGRGQYAAVFVRTVVGEWSVADTPAKAVCQAFVSCLLGKMTRTPEEILKWIDEIEQSYLYDSSGHMKVSSELLKLVKQLLAELAYVELENDRLSWECAKLMTESEADQEQIVHQQWQINQARASVRSEGVGCGEQTGHGFEAQGSTDPGMDQPA